MISGFRVSDTGFAYARYENENKTFRLFILLFCGEQIALI